MKTYLSLEQVAEKLGVCRMTVYRMVRAGKIPYIKVGPQYRIAEDAIETIDLGVQ